MPEKTKVKAPKEVQHNWVYKQHHRFADGGELNDFWLCEWCDGTTANLPAYRYEVCEVKDRRKGLADRRI